MPWKDELPVDQKHNLSPNISVTPYPSQSFAYLTISLARLAINGSSLIRQTALRAWLIGRTALAPLLIKLLSLCAELSLNHVVAILPGAQRNCSSF